MIPEIVLQTTMKTSGDLVLILHHEDPVPQGFISPEHTWFVQQQIEKKQTLIPVFEDYHWRVVLIMPKEEQSATFLENCRKEGDKLQQWTNQQQLESILLIDIAGDGSAFLAVAEGMAMGNHQFLKYKTRDVKPNTLKTIDLFSSEIRKKEIKILNATLQAVGFARDLVNEPYSTLDTATFAKEVEQRAKEAGLDVDVLQKKKLESLQMGGILGVNQGSKEPPVMIQLEHKPAKPHNKQPILLVGKGIVYDTGGMNLKPEKSMEYMKHDMAGGAAVAGAMIALADAGLPLHVIALIPVTDNRPGEEAIVSGDLLKMHNGMTVEVVNTDAEGRLILADALSYGARYKPMLGIDLSTLTGSAIRSIGKAAIAGMESDAGIFLTHLKDAGMEVYERIIEFPLWEDYMEPLKSDIADIRNLGGPFAGVIIAGKFLQQFVTYPYVHLDIAGPAFHEKRDGYRGEGGTGVGVRLLMEFFKNQ
jgi:leucyl aminopeptidase